VDLSLAESIAVSAALTTGRQAGHQTRGGADRGQRREVAGSVTEGLARQAAPAAHPVSLERHSKHGLELRAAGLRNLWARGPALPGPRPV
jgi:hypothetical protein